MPIVTISADVVAWYGAIVATIAVIIPGVVAWRDRSRLKIQWKPNMEVHRNGRQAQQCVITVSNMGRRPLRISVAGVQFYDNTGVSLNQYSGDQLLLSEENPALHFLMSPERLEGKKIFYVWVQGASGHLHKKYLTLFPSLVYLWWCIKSKGRKV